MFIKAMWFSLFKVHRRCHFVQRWNWWKIRFGSILLFRQSSSLLNNTLLHKPKHADSAALRDIVKSFLEQKWKKNYVSFFSPLPIDFLQKETQKETSLTWGKENFFKWHTAPCFSLQFSNVNLKLKILCRTRYLNKFSHFFFFDRFFICNALWIIVFWCLWYWIVVQMMILNEFFDNRQNLQIHTHHKLLYDSTLTT